MTVIKGDFLVPFCLIGFNVICFFFGVTTILAINVFGIMICFALIYRHFAMGKIGLVSFIVVCVYCLPFIHLIPYLWFDFKSNPLLMWGMAPNPYQLNEDVIALLVSLATAGVASFALMSSFIKSNSNQMNAGWNQNNSVKKRFVTLNLLAWVFLLFGGVYLSYLSAPSESIFTSQYATVSSSSREANVSSVWLGSYIILIFVTVDTVFDFRPNRRRIKGILLLCALLYIVIVLQFLRGDRESLPWVLSLFLVYYYWCDKYRNGIQSSGIKASSAVLVGVGFVGASFLVAITRSSLTGSDLAMAGALIYEFALAEGSNVSNLFKGTWSAVLLTPLSVAGDYVYDLMKFNLGQDYLDLLASIPPGFVADTLNFERPIGLGSGPATEMRYGQGGTHALVLPFRGFGIVGIVFITAIWYSILLRIERSLLRKFNVFSVSALASIVAVAPHWIWYGEKNIINGVIYYFIAAILYVLLISFSLAKDKIYRF